MSNFAEAMAANIIHYGEEVTTFTIGLYMRSYVEVLNKAYVPLHNLKRYEKDLFVPASMP
jgi:hypothetical protein